MAAHCCQCTRCRNGVEATSCEVAFYCISPIDPANGLNDYAGTFQLWVTTFASMS